jgi:hypothetical protein
MCPLPWGGMPQFLATRAALVRTEQGGRRRAASAALSGVVAWSLVEYAGELSRQFGRTVVSNNVPAERSCAF